MKKLLLAGVASLALVVSAQENKAPVLSMTLPKTGTISKDVAATVKVHFAEGLHGYQNPPSADYLIPVSITSTNKEVKIKSVKYPKGVVRTLSGEKVAVYEGDISIPVTLNISGAKGKRTITLTVNYQQCHENGCFPPGTSRVSQTITLN